MIYLRFVDLVWLWLQTASRPSELGKGTTFRARLGILHEVAEDPLAGTCRT